MKVTCTIIFLFISSIACLAQQNTKTDSCFTKLDSLTGKTVYIMPGKMPVIENAQNFLKEIIKRLKPQTGSIESRITVAFIIDEHGKVSGKRIIRGKELAQQVLTILDDFSWKVATCQGEKVPVLYMLPIIIDFRE